MTNQPDEDRELKKAQILAIPGAYIQDGLISIHNHEFMEDLAFAAAYRRGVAAAGTDYGWHWRVHVGLWAASVARRLPGDFVECGVNAGFMSSSIMQFLDWNSIDKTFYLLDTFSGIDERYVSPAERAEGILQKNAKLLESRFYVTDMDAVERNFAEWKRIRIVKGSIPDTLARVESRQIAFLHIDMNCAPPEVAALEHFWERLVQGAPVVLDDYAYWGYRQQKLAMDELAARLGVAIMSLPTGQGLLLRP
jgi:macrocin-O-methyltransferase TylF-like protien